MIITKTPFRISFLGGGTDYPAWYRKHCGAVLSTTIDKYCYITCRELSPFFDHKYRISYSKYEYVNSIDEIEHPAVREVLRFMGIPYGVEIHTDADIPAKSGIGSSSSFTVGLLNGLYALKMEMASKQQLANDAIYIEQEIIKENVGSQDQCAAAYGGLNKIEFNHVDGFKVNPIVISVERKNELQDHILFFFTGIQRLASNVAMKQIKETSNNVSQLVQMYDLVDEALSVLLNEKIDITEFGKLLDLNWELKKTLTNEITNSVIDEIYQAGIKAGAAGGKLIGAGSGGFIVFLAKPCYHKEIRFRLKNLVEVPIKFENHGSQIIYYDNN